MKKKTVLILAVDWGGHKSLAEATQEALATYYPQDIEAIIAYPNSTPFILPMYHKMVTEYQQQWELLYNISNNANIAVIINNLAALIVEKDVERLIDKHKPDVVVSNLSFFSSIVERLKKERGFTTALMIADPFTVHETFFTSKEFDIYFTPSEKAYKSALAHGIPAKKAIKMGWPIRKQFTKTVVKKSEDVFTVFIGGSVSGGSNVLELIESITHQFDKIPLQLIIVCGKNVSLKKKLVEATTDLEHVRIFGFVDNLANLIAASDVVVGKAGPNLLFESIYLQKPFIATGFIKGQEQGNLDLIRAKHIGWVMFNTEKTAELLYSLYKDRDLLKQTAENMRRVEKEMRFDSKKLASTIASLAG